MEQKPFKTTELFEKTFDGWFDCKKTKKGNKYNIFVVSGTAISNRIPPDTMIKGYKLKDLFEQDITFLCSQDGVRIDILQILL